MAGLGPDFRIFKSGSGPDFIYLVCVIYIAVSRSGTGYYRTSPGTCPDPDSTNISFHGPAKFLVLDSVPTFPFCSRRIQRAFGVLPMVPMAYHCRLKFCHWQSFVTIGTNGYHWLPFGFTIGSQSCRQPRG